MTTMDVRLIPRGERPARQRDRAEFRRIEPGMTRGTVERLFGAGGGCAYRPPSDYSLAATTSPSGL
jgi:hypothetical protein